MKKKGKPSTKSSAPAKVPDKFELQVLEDPDDSSWGIVGGVRRPKEHEK